ncbi:unnamed protein product [Adineta steineri]|uniref:G-protein coupled receptors family 1 profile domain-containing protein n=1 Tax=Adineta steineri TaxID=433720 RepID=A0A814LEV8_9BILA|nr:unnamed protein product [Adineta steineri]CAF1063787.1 unnamed protein product [Adineta steineri]CAF1097713.1 unnamed protein product [Adineta steineri]CAF3790051.1 unnamed protein product [Adineta steineri]CAF3819340.1 unnamed protein product [Adineta steineri]
MSFNYSTIFDEDLSPDDPLFWSLPTPVNCDSVRTLGIFLCIAALVGIVCNGALVYSFARYKALRTPSNIFVMFIAGIGLFASCTILPLTGTSSIYCQWLYQRAGCQFSAIVAFLYGCASSYLLCGVSLSRCYMIVRPFKAKDVTVNKCIIISIISILIAFIWTMLPLMGWNEYTMDAARTSCCINWYDRRASYVSYLFFLFIVVYCIPLVILVIANRITLQGLKRMHQNIENGIQTGLNRKRIEMERRIVRSIIITTCGFIVTWTPYAVTFFASAFRGKEYALPPMVTFSCACIAKSSVIWIPMLYIGTSTHYQLQFVNQDALNEGIPNNRGNTVLPNIPRLSRKIDDIAMNPVRRGTVDN